MRILGLLVLGFAASVLQSAVAFADEAAELMALEARWNQAIVDKDLAALDEILAPDFVYIADDGSKLDKKSLLAVVERPQVRMDPLTTRDVSVRLYGSTAVVTGRFLQTLRAGDKHVTRDVAYTDVYVKDDKGWRPVAAHSSHVASTAPSTPAH